MKIFVWNWPQQNIGFSPFVIPSLTDLHQVYHVQKKAQDDQGATLTEWRQNEDRMKTEWRQNEEPSGTQLISLDGMKTAITHLELATPKRSAGYIFDRL